ncbi:calcium-activated chloride channel regulator 1-like [Centruroides sculpturatus]|uniref:calcium-activated chloride channel regulator 1-like n=1 Tax=Centruroides sculpturatus TaxID=218467 RepID=UPI000C6D4FA1|nr:calcium-activated chloride channel regulator 1-like [Centruroides sculpturatus]
MFYQDSGKMYPTSCIKNIKGWIESKNGGPCYILEGGYVDKDCIFIPDMHHQDVTASIMYMPFIPTMDGFCDKTDERFHNVRAPTRQNALCQYRSTWNIVASHPDFQKKNRTTRQAEELTEILFRIVKHGNLEGGRFVLVLDVSGSMNGQPIQLLHQAATRFVEDRIPDGSYLGIIQFSTYTQVLYPLTKVTNQTRYSLSKSLPDKDDGGTTAIGKALEAGIEVLKNNTDDSIEGGVIILITDGEENVVPFIKEKVPRLLKEKVIVNTVAFGNMASDKLENLTKITGGKGFFFGDLNGTRPTSDLDAAFLESVTSQADIDLQPVKIVDEMIYFMERNETYQERRIWIDKELGKNTIFTFLSTVINGFDMQIYDPNNKLYDKSSPEFSIDMNVRKRIQVTIPNAQSGQWTIRFHRTQFHLPITISMSLTSEPKDIRDQPIRVRSWLSDFQLEFPAHAKVYAEVKKGYNAVVNAKVIATVERPMGKSVDIVLKDSGAGADVLQNDGIYSAYFTHFNGNGRYAVVANVVNDGGAKLKRGSRSSSALPIPKIASKTAKESLGEPTNSFPLEDFVFTTEKKDETIDAEPIDHLQRISETGAFRVQNWKRKSKDNIPPGNITDLIVLGTNPKRHALLTWTSPGDNLDEGIVSSLELRSDLDPEILLSNFNESFLYNSSHVINGTLEPLPPGALQIVVIKVPDEFFPSVNNTSNKTVYFAVRAIDKNGNVSPGYNLALASFNFNFYGRKPNSNKPFRWWPAVVGIGIAILLMIALMIGLIIIFHRKKNHKFEKVYCE